MKKVYLIIILLGFLLAGKKLSAQCSVNISTNPNSTQLNCVNKSLTLTANVQGSGTITYAWSTRDTTPSIIVKDPGIYTVFIEDGQKCKTSSSVHITKDINTPIVTARAFPDVICSGNTSNLVGFGADSYLWQPGSLPGADTLVRPAATTTYTVTGTAVNGCISTSKVTVVVHSIPDASISGTDTVCQNSNPPSLITFTGWGGTLPYTFAYNVNGDSALPTIPTVGKDTTAHISASTNTKATLKYTLTRVTDGNGCTQAQIGKKVTIKVLDALYITNNESKSICDNVDVSWTPKSNHSKSINTYSWRMVSDTGIISNSPLIDNKPIKGRIHNTTSELGKVRYHVNLVADGCATTDSLIITVNPIPVIDSIANKTFCNGEYVTNGIPFRSSSLDSSFTWTSNDTSIGLGAGGSGSIDAFNAKNVTAKPITVLIKVSIEASSQNCKGVDRSFPITVLPSPVITSIKDTSLCNGAEFIYTALSSVDNTTFNWTRASVAGIRDSASSGPGATISETLHNDTSQPVAVKYIYTLSTGNGCKAEDSIKVTVYPTFGVDYINDTTICNGERVNGIPFKSSSPDAGFAWTNSNLSIGLQDNGINDSIPAFFAINNSDTAVKSSIKVTATIKAGEVSCYGNYTSFTITVNPSPPKPNFTSLSRYPDYDTLRLCSGAENINFNVNAPVPGVSYKWTSTAKPLMPSIRDTNDANTVISFAYPGRDTINAIAIDTTGSCADTVSQIVQVDNITTGIYKRGVFLMQPGNLLIYPDNSLAAYQWGYDTIIHTSPASAFGSPVSLQGQVYQFFIPSAKFIDSISNSLDTTNYLYWVILQNGNCYTKVYYNGPYANRPIQITPPDNNVQLQVFPNPNNGNFKMSLKGNIYGKIDAKIYNSFGQIVFRKDFLKTIPEINETFNTNILPGGFYLLVLESSDLKQVVSRFVIQH